MELKFTDAMDIRVRSCLLVMRLEGACVGSSDRTQKTHRGEFRDMSHRRTQRDRSGWRRNSGCLFKSRYSERNFEKKLTDLLAGDPRPPPSWLLWASGWKFRWWSSSHDGGEEAVCSATDLRVTDRVLSDWELRHEVKSPQIHPLSHSSTQTSVHAFTIRAPASAGYINSQHLITRSSHNHSIQSGLILAIVTIYYIIKFKESCLKTILNRSNSKIQKLQH